jgi:hypothetical protein
MEAGRARQRLNRVFQTGEDWYTSNHLFRGNEMIRPRNRQQACANVGRVSSKTSSPRGRLSKPDRNRAFPHGYYWQRGDMRPLSFALTLLALGTLAAAQSERPVLWLLLGPGPLAIAIVVTAFLRRKGELCAYWRDFRLRHVKNGKRYQPRGTCPFQCPS